MRMQPRTYLSIAVACCALALVAAGCGNEESERSTSTKSDAAMAKDDAMAKDEDAMGKDDDAMANDEDAMATNDAMATDDAMRPKGEDGLRVAAQAAQIVAKDSEFGTILFDANGQVVYAFENDRRDTSNCVSDDCVTAWPPVLTRSAPTAGAGVRGNLLGTIRRTDGSMQVTYAGRPLYFYEHEAPGEIKCHDVFLHGGLWWVVAPDGVPVGT